MDKAGVAGLALSLAACAGLGATFVQGRRLAAAVDDLTARAAKFDAAPAPAANPAASPDYSRDILQLRSEIAALRQQHASFEAALARATAGAPAAVDPAVAEAERKALEQKRQKEWIDRTSRAVTDRLARDLGLTEHQRQAVARLIEAQFAEIRSLSPDPKDPQGLRKRMEEARQRTEAGIREVLTPEQVSKFEELAKNPTVLWTPGGGDSSRLSPPGVEVAPSDPK